ncbi:DUF4974 domain-containing protein [Chitinophaga lutea]|uniref:DUF4974 domain-containing protein n=1 Tax=Chitinophaga lutea TaxID=2488634 RepID=A0A3N4Q5S8_9BACT|nr:FecR domain-containing protein [Chitinophaga lutea]RPE12881.1 DUF4974 domain-containing protein [Chitinophaga lutea]
MSNLQPDEALYSLLCKYLLNEADTVERQWVEAWRMEQPVNEEVLNGIRQVLEASASAAAHPGIDTGASWERLKTTITAGGEENVVPIRRPFPWLRIAAVLLVAVGAAFWLWPRQAQQETAFSGGQKAVLKDGSQVALQPNADLKLAGGFGKKERRVRLTGKAIFTVAQDPEAPFVVEVDQTEIKVLGTEFTVDYGPQTGLTVHVNSGKVLVTDRRHGDSAVLTPGMVLRQEVKETGFSVAENIINLSSKQLVFRNVPLHKVLAAVEAVYDVDVKVADSALLQKEITANFENESIENVMAAITYMTNSQAEKTGQQQFSIK